MENIPAGYRLILYISLTDLYVSLTGTLRRTFPQTVPHTFQPFLSWLDSAPGSVSRRLSPALTGYCLFRFQLLCRLYLWPPDVARQPLRVILDAFGKDRVKYPQRLTGYRHHRLHLFERVLLPRPVILVYLPKLCVLSHQRYSGLVQHIPQAFPPPVTDTAFSVMLARIICHDGISRQLLQLFGVVKTSYVPHLCYKAADCYHPNPLDRQQVIYIWDLLQLFFYPPEQFYKCPSDCKGYGN